jgi:hypothetical protein
VVATHLHLALWRYLWRIPTAVGDDRPDGNGLYLDVVGRTCADRLLLKDASGIHAHPDQALGHANTFGDPAGFEFTEMNTCEQARRFAA